MSATTSETPLRTVAAVIRGRVQGVGYRYWTRERATRLGLSGHVRNRTDGAVEALFSGAPQAVAAMIEACRQGPPGAQVEEVSITEPDGVPPEGAFRILRG